MPALHLFLLTLTALIGGIVLYALGKPEAAVVLVSPVMLLLVQQVQAAKKKEAAATQRAAKAEDELFSQTGVRLPKE